MMMTKHENSIYAARQIGPGKLNSVSLAARKALDARDFEIAEMGRLIAQNALGGGRSFRAASRNDESAMPCLPPQQERGCCAAMASRLGTDVRGDMTAVVGSRGTIFGLR